MPFNVLWESALQREFPPAMLGRVTSVDWMASVALLPVGLALVGPAVEALGREPVLMTAVVVQVATSVLVLVVPGVPTFGAHGVRDRLPVGPPAGAQSR